MEIIVLLLLAGVVVGIGLFKFRGNLYNKYNYDVMSLGNNILAFVAFFAPLAGINSIFIGTFNSMVVIFIIVGLASLGGLMYRHIKHMNITAGILLGVAQMIAITGIVVWWIFCKCTHINDRAMFGDITYNTANTKKQPVKRGMSERQYYESQGVIDSDEGNDAGVPSYEGTKQQEDFEAFEKEKKEVYYN